MKAPVCHAPVVSATVVKAPVLFACVGSVRTGTVPVPEIKSHPLLLDFWTFSKGNNADESRDRIVGLNNHVLRAYNFLWEALSGYGHPDYPAGMACDGIDDYLEAEEWIFPGSDYTVIAKVTPFEKRWGNSIFSTRDFNTGTSGWNTLSYEKRNETLHFGNQTYKKSTKFVSASGATELLAMVRNGDTITLYRGMNRFGTVEIPPGTPNHKAYYLGVKRGISNSCFRGIIHCNAVYSGALTTDELRTEMNEAFPFYENIIMNR
ncbi:LamG-like jellyroll fold domain-containing protein [Bacteroides fragilis]